MLLFYTSPVLHTFLLLNEKGESLSLEVVDEAEIIFNLFFSYWLLFDIILFCFFFPSSVLNFHLIASSISIAISTRFVFDIFLVFLLLYFFDDFNLHLQQLH